jgi:hypothetical protein
MRKRHSTYSYHSPPGFPFQWARGDYPFNPYSNKFQFTTTRKNGILLKSESHKQFVSRDHWVSLKYLPTKIRLQRTQRIVGLTTELLWFSSVSISPATLDNSSMRIGVWLVNIWRDVFINLEWWVSWTKTRLHLVTGADVCYRNESLNLIN